jgi:hypothetical protein
MAGFLHTNLYICMHITSSARSRSTGHVQLRSRKRLGILEVKLDGRMQNVFYMRVRASIAVPLTFGLGGP